MLNDTTRSSIYRTGRVCIYNLDNVGFTGALDPNLELFPVYNTLANINNDNIEFEEINNLHSVCKSWNLLDLFIAE
jgi:hypothetical protein